MAQNAYVTFYGEGKLLPGYQNFDNLEMYLKRREALYRHVGLVPLLCRNRRILEFGPGAGFNSVFTACLGPSYYELVEGDHASLETLSQLMSEYSKSNTEYKIIEGLIENHFSEGTFDLVICEATIPMQENPEAILKKVSQFVAPGGILLITVCDEMSYLPEILRRLVANTIAHSSDSFEEKAASLLPYFGPHLETIEEMSRPHKHYIIDNYLQPLAGRRLFGMGQAIELLHGEFDFYACSPHFSVDWRWYKEIYEDSGRYNDLALDNYYSNLHNLMDYRIDHRIGSKDSNRSALKFAGEVYNMVVEMEDLGPNNSLIEPVLDDVLKISGMLPECAELSARSLLDFIRAYKQISRGNKDIEWGQFSSFYGHSQQFVTFLRRV